MATTIRKTTTGETKYVISFDDPPTAQQLKKAINDLPDLTAVTRRVEDGANGQAKNPVRFVFVVVSQDEVEVPQT